MAYLLLMTLTWTIILKVTSKLLIWILRRVLVFLSMMWEVDLMNLPKPRMVAVLPSLSWEDLVVMSTPFFHKISV